MNRHVLILLPLLLALQTFGQGSIRFDNRVTGISSSAVVAPIYGVDFNDPYYYGTGRKAGNASTGPTTPIPTGTQTYGGAPLVGTGYTASLWARQARSSGGFVLAATTAFMKAASLIL